MEDVLGFKVSLIGDDDSLKKLDKFNDKLEKMGKRLDAINKQTAKLPGLTKQLKALEKALTTDNSKQIEKTTDKQEELNEEIKESVKTVAELRKEINRLKQSGEVYDDLVKQAGELKAEQQATNRQINLAAQEFKQLTAAAGSYRQSNAELVKLRNQYRELSDTDRESKIGRGILLNIQQLDKELKGIDKDLGQYYRNVGNYVSAWDGMRTVVLEFAALAGVAGGLNEIIQQNAEISDAVADAAKTTGLTIEQVQQLSDALEGRDTRTSLADQLGIAEIGGRLSIAEKDLLGFVESIDTANVALGDQFNNSAEEVTDTLAGLRNVLVNFQTDDISLDILQIGNALNVLETQGVATAPVIADFVNRIGGTAVPLGASTESIFGLATTLNELQVTAERGGTATVALLNKVASETDKFGNFVVESGLIGSVEEFEKLVEDDIVSAFGLVTKASQESTDTNIEFSKLLKELGITGAGNTEVFAKLGANTELLAQRTETANAALQNTDSLLEEFDKKNNTLGASIDKLRNQFIALIVDADIQNYLQTGVDAVASFLERLQKLPEFIEENRVQLQLLGIALASFKVKAAIAGIQNLALAYRSWAAATQGATIAQKLLNVAMKANPIGLVTTAIVTLVGAMVTLYQRSEAVREVVDGLTRRFLEFYENNLLVRAALFNIVEPLKIIFGLFREGPSFLSTYAKSVKIFVQDIGDQFLILVNKAKILGLQLQNSLTINADRSRGIEARIKEIEGSITASQERIQARNEQFNQEQLEREIELAKKKEEENKKAEANITKTQEEESTKRQELTDKERKAAEKAAEDRLKAAKKIADLENELIENVFDRREAQARKAADAEITSLVGSPDQIDRQTELIREKLSKQLEVINSERKAAERKALESVANFNKELEQLQTSLGVSSAEAELSTLQRAFEIDQGRLKAQLQTSLNTLRIQLKNNEISYEEYFAGINAAQDNFSQRSLNLERLNGAEVARVQAELTQHRLSSLQQELNAELAIIEARRQANIASLQGEFDAGNLTEGELASGEQSVDALAEQQAIEAKQNAESEKLRIASEFALKQLEVQQQLSQEEAALQDQDLKRYQEYKAAQEHITATFFSDVLSASGDFFRDQEKDSKAFLKNVLLIALEALEKTIVLAIAEASAKSFAQTDSVASFGATGLIRSAILTGLIKAAFSGVKGLIDNFEGGTATDGISNAPGQSGVPSASGSVLGKSHASGGKLALVAGKASEIEGGEYKLRNGNMTYLINKKSSGIFRSALQKMSKNGNVYSPARHDLASSINSYNGFGQKFQSGVAVGVNDPLRIQPVEAPRVFINNSSGMDDQQFDRLSNLLISQMLIIDNKTDAINSRIDNLKVINDPSETVDIGNDLLKTQNENKL